MDKYINKNKQKSEMLIGSSLIEMIVTIGIIAISLGVVAGVLLAMVRASQRSTLTSKLRSNGDFAYGIIQEYIRSARQIDCYDTTTGSYVSGCKKATYPFYTNEIKVKTFNNDSFYIGVKTGPNPCNNGYIYLTAIPDADPSNDIPEVQEKDKVTDDNPANGVDIIEGADASSPYMFEVTKAESGVYIVNLKFRASNDRCNSPVTGVETYNTGLFTRPNSL